MYTVSNFSFTDPSSWTAGLQRNGLRYHKGKTALLRLPANAAEISGHVGLDQDHFCRPNRSAFSFGVNSARPSVTAVRVHVRTLRWSSDDWTT